MAEPETFLDELFSAAVDEGGILGDVLLDQGPPPVRFSAAHDVSGEKRDKSGEWTAGGEKGSSPKETSTASKATPSRATKTEHLTAIRKSLAKLASVPQPTEADVARAKEGMMELGANVYRKKLIGNSYDKKARREKLLAEFGDGTHCPCIYCGTLLTHGTLEQDKIKTTAEGGKYKMENLVPACGACNKQRGDKPFSAVAQKLAAMAEGHDNG